MNSFQQQEISGFNCSHRYAKYLIVGLNKSNCMMAWETKQQPLDCKYVYISDLKVSFKLESYFIRIRRISNKTVELDIAT